MKFVWISVNWCLIFERDVVDCGCEEIEYIVGSEVYDDLWFLLLQLVMSLFGKLILLMIVKVYIQISDILIWFKVNVVIRIVFVFVGEIYGRLGDKGR